MDAKHKELAQRVVDEYFNGKFTTKDEYETALAVATKAIEEMENETDELNNTILNMKYTISTLLAGNKMLSQKIAEKHNDDDLNF